MRVRGWQTETFKFGVPGEASHWIYVRWKGVEQDLCGEGMARAEDAVMVPVGRQEEEEEGRGGW